LRSAAAHAEEVLHFQNLRVNGGAVAVEGADAVHLVAFLGDAGALWHYSSQAADDAGWIAARPPSESDRVA